MKNRGSCPGKAVTEGFFIRQKSGGHLHKPMEPIVKTPHGNSSQAKKLKMEEQQQNQNQHHQLGLEFVDEANELLTNSDLGIQVIDSAQIIDFVDLNSNTTCDLGTGGGMPGLIVAIAMKKIKNKANFYIEVNKQR